MAAALSLRWSGYFTFKCIRQYTFINNEVTQNKHLFSASFIKRVVRQFSKLPSLCGVAPLPLEMPSLSPTMTQGRIVKWLKKEGEDVAVGDALCEIETDKAVVVMESSEDGVLAKILVQEDSPQVNLGTLIALMVGEGEDWRKLDVSLLKATAAAEAQTPTQTLPPPAATQQWRLSPAARHILDTHGLGAHLAKATGPRGVITKEDALNLINQHSKVTSHPASAATAPAPVDLSPPSVQSPASPPPPPPPRKPAAVASFTEIPASSVRKVIAERLTHSKSSIPHVYASVDCDLESVMKLRKQLAEENIKVSVNDFIIKVAAVTLKEIPTVNIVLSPEGPRPLDSIHISIAVATPRGLITPIIRDAASKGLVEIAATAKALSQKARDGKLLPEEYQGGSFSISNLGMFGIREFSAVINPPQACILAVGNARSELKLDQQNSEEPRVHINKQITVTLSSDGRLVDEELASQFLKQFRCNLEQPQRLALV